MNAVAIIVILVAIALTASIAWASLKCHAWGWCPTCREFWSDSGDKTPVEPLTATGPVLHDRCPECAQLLANTQNPTDSTLRTNF